MLHVESEGWDHFSEEHDGVIRKVDIILTRGQARESKEDMIRLIANAPEMLATLQKIRHAFYTEGTSKALRPVMAEMVEMLRHITG